MRGQRRFRQLHSLVASRRCCPRRIGLGPKPQPPDGQGEPPPALATPGTPQRCAYCAITQPGGGDACQRCGRPFPDPASDLLQRLQARGVNFALDGYNFSYQTSSPVLRQTVEENRETLLRALRRDAAANSRLRDDDPIKPAVSEHGCVAIFALLYLCMLAAMWMWSRLG